MKIVLIVSGGVDRSGSERVIPALLWLVERLARAHQVLVIALQQEQTPSRYELLGATIINLGYARGKGHQSTAKVILHYLSAVYRAIQSWGKPDVIHSMSIGLPGFLAVLVGKSLRLPVVATIWGGELVALPEIGYGGQLRVSGRLLTKVTLRLADVLTGGSHYVINQLPKRYTAQWIPLGVDSNLFRPGVHGPSAVKNRLLIVASINRVKNPTLILSALQQLKGQGVNVQVDWVGIDTLHGEIQQQASAMGLTDQICFHGIQPSGVVSQFCQQAALYVQTSWHESQGVSILEAAASGVPIVGTKVGLVAELSPTAAIATPIGDANALAAAIQALLADSNRYSALSKAARAFATTYNADWTMQQFEQLYQHLCASGNNK